MKKLKRILSIDGGGIKGIIPGTILVALEEKLKNKTGNPDVRIADYFDIIAGTSTGGILSCMYLTPNEDGRPKFTAEEILNLYLKKGNKIFDIPFFFKLKNFGGILDEKYPSKSIEELLESYLGDTKLSDLLKPSLITSYDMHSRKSVFFRQQNAIKNKEDDFLLRDVARSTSAAPTYFELAHISSLAGKMYPLIDGGLVANNPALCAYSEARKIFSSKSEKIIASDMVIFSIGTGVSKEHYEYKDVKDWGMVQWIKPLLDVLFSAGSETINFQLEQIFDANDVSNQYIRIQSELPDYVSTDMDNVTEENLKALHGFGKMLVLDNEAELDKLVDMLIQEEQERKDIVT